MTAFMQGNTQERERILQELESEFAMGLKVSDMELRQKQHALDERRLTEGTLPYQKAITEQVGVSTETSEFKLEEMERLREENITLQQKIDLLAREQEGKGLVDIKAETGLATEKGKLAVQQEVPKQAPKTTEKLGEDIEAVKQQTALDLAKTLTENELRDVRKRMYEAQAKNYEAEATKAKSEQFDPALFTKQMDLTARQELVNSLIEIKPNLTPLAAWRLAGDLPTIEQSYSRIQQAITIKENITKDDVGMREQLRGLMSAMGKSESAENVQRMSSEEIKVEMDKIIEDHKFMLLLLGMKYGEGQSLVQQPLDKGLRQDLINQGKDLRKRK
jgi:hypothetical protein